MRAVALSALKAGITRLRDKGGASPDSLYDLVNGYIDASGAPTCRQGTSMGHTLPAGTKGLCAFEGKLHVFAMSVVDPGDDLYVVDILIHPDPDFAGTLVAIHFAKPFLGFLYVVAEFSDGNIYHYWLQSKDAWAADTVYLNTDTVRPTTVNGFIYSPTTTVDPPAWQPATSYAVGDVVQPSTYNGYQYTVKSISGDPAVSGETEPSWEATDGALVYDYSSSLSVATSTNESSGGSPAGSRYDNMAGKTFQLDEGG